MEEMHHAAAARTLLLMLTTRSCFFPARYKVPQDIQPAQRHIVMTCEAANHVSSSRLGRLGQPAIRLTDIGPSSPVCEPIMISGGDA